MGERSNAGIRRQRANSTLAPPLHLRHVLLHRDDFEGAPPWTSLENGRVVVDEAPATVSRGHAATQNWTDEEIEWSY